MKAIHVEDDDDRSLVWSDHPTPEPGPNEVLVEMHATSVNRPDLIQRLGGYPPPDGASEILGLDAAGTIAEVGADVQGWEMGDRVCALLPGGAYAQYAAIPAPMLLEVPEELDLPEAAGIPEVFYTAYLNLRLEADHSDGESVLVHAGASGVGTAALQLCELFDAPAYATASSGKLDVLRELGVEAAIDRHDEDFVEVVREATDDRGVDVILDPVTGDYIPRDLQALAPRGRLLVLGLLRGSSAELPLGTLLRNCQRIIGSVLRPRSLEEKIEITEAFRREVWPHFATGELEPVIYDRLSITEAERAHEMLRANETVGKVILDIQ